MSAESACFTSLGKSWENVASLEKAQIPRCAEETLQKCESFRHESTTLSQPQSDVDLSCALWSVRRYGDAHALLPRPRFQHPKPICDGHRPGARTSRPRPVRQLRARPARVRFPSRLSRTREPQRQAFESADVGRGARSALEPRARYGVRLRSS